MEKEVLLQALKHISDVYFNKKDYMSAGRMNIAMDVINEYDGTLPKSDCVHPYEMLTFKDDGEIYCKCGNKLTL